MMMRCNWVPWRKASTLGASEYAIIEQQARKYLWVSNLTGRKSLLYTSNNLACLGYPLDDSLTIAIQFVELDELAHLVIICLRVRIYHLLWCLAPIHVIAKIIEYHVAIKNSALSFQRSLGKAIVVVPRFHVIDNCLDVAI